MWSDLTKLSIGTVATLAVPYNNNVSLEERAVPSAQLFAYPVPSEGDTRVWVQNHSAGRIRLHVVDAMGRIMYLLHEGLLEQGKQAFDVPLGNLAPGTYRAVFTRADGTKSSVALVRTAQ